MNSIVKKILLIAGIFFLGVFTSSLYFKLSKLNLNDTFLNEQLVGSLEQTKHELEILQIETNKLSLLNKALLKQIDHQNEEQPEGKHTRPLIVDQNEEPKEDAKSSFFKMMTPDFLKTTVGMQLNPIKMALKHELDLSEEQFEKLSVLLKEKVESDIDASAPLFEKMANNGGFKKMIENSMEGKQPIDDYMTDINQHLDVNQKLYQEHLSTVLSTSQIEKYQAYEIKKQRQQYEMIMSMQSSMVMNNISNIQDYQRDEINRFFKEQQSNQPEAKIGTSGSSFAQNKGASMNNFQSELNQHLQQILSSDQFQDYKESHKKMIAGFSGMFGG